MGADISASIEKHSDMKNFIYFQCICIVIISISCSQGEKRILNADTIIYVNHENINEEVMKHASNYIEDVQYIPLETSETNLIGNLSKVILSTKYIHIHDNQTNNLYQFDYDGKYVRKVGNEGNGPNEYIKISTFSINPETENIAIYCEVKQSIIEFTHEGLPISEERVGFVCNDFMYYKNDYLFYGGRSWNKNIFKNTFPEQYRLVLWGKNEIKENYLPFKYNESLYRTSIASGNNSLYTYNKTRLIEKCTGIVYELDNDISPVYAIDFGKYTIREDFYSDRNINDNSIQRIEKSDYCLLSSLFETDNYVYIYYIVSMYSKYRMIFSCIYSKKINELVNIGPLWVNDIDNISMPKVITSYNNNLIGYFDSDNLKTMLVTNKNPLTPRMEELKETVDDFDNPIICIIKLKDY